MKYEKLINSKKVNGTHYQGEIDIKYDEIVAVIGNPCHDGDGYKVDAEWVLEFEDGTLATIYNWKDGKNYLGDMGHNVKQICNWHIGGHDQYAIDRVYKLFMPRKHYIDWAQNNTSYKQIEIGEILKQTADFGE